MARNGWASSQEGKVFVEYRWWTIANGVTKSGEIFFDRINRINRILRACRSSGYEQLPNPRHNGAGVASDGIGIHRHVAPAEDLASLGLDHALDLRLLALAAEDHRNAKVIFLATKITKFTKVFIPLFVLFVSFVAERLFHDLPKEPVGDLHQQPRAVAGLRVVAGGAAVHEPLQDGHALLDDVVARLAGEVRDHADAARG